jgi:PST family polysaccharide transporter
MNFRAIAWCDTIAFVGAALLGIGLAAAGAGVWALVTQAVFTPLALGIARCISAKWFPRFRFSVEAVKSMTAFTANLYAFNFVNYWARNGDNLLIGKFFGASSLGVYNRAYALMLLPITQINSVVSQVAFPTLASLQHDKARVANLYCRALGMVTLIAFPVMSGMACVATPFILVLYGSKWAGVAPLLQILAVVGMIQVVVNSMGWIFLSQGRTDLLFRYGVIFSVAVVGSFLVGVRLGSPRALALSYGLANLICFLPWLYAASKVASTSIWQIVSSFTAPLASSFIMAGCVWGTARILPLGMPPVELLIIETAVGAAVYIVLVLAMKPESLGELKRLIRNYRNRAAVST